MGTNRLRFNLKILMKREMYYACIVCFFASALLCQRAWTAEKFTNFIGMQFVAIPAGSFSMGSCKPDATDCPLGDNRDSQAHGYEMPQHTVRISQGFMLGVYEVTLGQFKQFITEAHRTDLLTDVFLQENKNGDQAAVVQVSWNTVQDFIRWLNQKEGKQYRLPTEAEWEYAARAGTSTVYSFGNDASNIAQYAWYDGNSEGRVHEVGKLKPNAWGLYDMHGNVWEWCSDWWSETYYRTSPAVDPQGPASGQERSLRGGSWYFNPWYLRSALRFGHLPDSAYNRVGFRLVLTNTLVAKSNLTHR